MTVEQKLRLMDLLIQHYGQYGHTDTGDIIRKLADQLIKEKIIYPILNP